MNAKNAILAIALLIATVVVAIVNTYCVCCSDYLYTLTWLFWGLMIVVIIADWVSPLIKCCCQAKAQKEQKIDELKHAHQITTSVLGKKISDLEKTNTQLNEKLSSYNHSKYVDIEGFYEWLKLKLQIDKDYVKKSFSDALGEYENFKEKLK